MSAKCFWRRGQQAAAALAKCLIAPLRLEPPPVPALADPPTAAVESHRDTLSRLRPGSELPASRQRHSLHHYAGPLLHHDPPGPSSAPLVRPGHRAPARPHRRRSTHRCLPAHASLARIRLSQLRCPNHVASHSDLSHPQAPPDRPPCFKSWRSTPSSGALPCRPYRCPAPKLASESQPWPPSCASLARRTATSWSATPAYQQHWCVRPPPLTARNCDHADCLRARPSRE